MPTKSVAIRLPEELVEWLKAKAEREHRTLSNVIVDILLTAKENG
jgi:predicted DNA-binding protein